MKTIKSIREMANELSYADDGSHYDIDNSRNVFQKDYFQGLYVSKEGRIVSSEKKHMCKKN